ncbi:VWA domain-containing protein, partial [bacterium]
DRQMKLVQSAIRDAGVGFAMVGGEDSFLPGGWYGTPVAEALPVDLNIRQRKSFPSTSVAIMVDASGSMGMIEDGFPKIRLAAQAAEQTVKLLSPMDRVAVAGSSDGIEFVVPMQKLSDKAAVATQLRKLDINGGGIYIRPTMDKAESILNAETTKVRHHILLADGNDSEDQGGALGVALRMRENKITTSVVSIGDGKDVAFLKQLAAAGGGRFYLAKRAGQLPAIFTQDTAIMSRSAIEEGAFLPRMVAGEEILRGIDGTPPLLAYCLTDRRPLARTSMLTKKDDPLLASWQYGLGTSLAFTSDATARWARNWVGWPGYDAFWSQAARAIGRRATQNRYQATVGQEAGKGLIELSATDSLGNPVTNNEATVRVATPIGGSREVTLTQSAPGRFQGSFDAEEIGSYLVTVAEPDRKGGMLTRTTATGIAYPAEYRTVNPNRPLLARLGETTGGKGLTKPEEALRPARDPGRSITELWPMLLMAAAILLPIDVGVRRVALPMGEIFARVWARLRQRPVKEQVETVGRLQQAKARAQTAATPTAKVDVTPAEPRTPQKTEAPKAASGGSHSPAGSLLEAKRKRRGE